MKSDVTTNTSKVDLIAADTALLSLRSSGHDYCSAVGEVIDNSLQANANNIRCRIFNEKKKIGKNKKRAIEVVSCLAVGDDGDGMDIDTLHRSLTLGYSTRYDDRTGMGRFGVGAKLGGISQAKRIDIYSRQDTGQPWLSTYIDLDEIHTGRMRFIPAPVETQPPKECKELTSETGTLVVWSKTDRLEETENGGGRRADTVKTNLVQYIARTFRRFLDGGISIELDGINILPHDPLFIMSSTRWHKNGKPDPLADIKVNESIDFPIPSNPFKKSKVWVTLTLLPKEFRMGRGAGGNAFAKERRIPESEGVSILRADREIFNGYLRGVQPSLEGRQIDRFIGKEIRFEPELDECFQVRNVKKGAEPIEGLRDKLRDLIHKSVQTLRNDVRDHFTTVENQKLSEEGLHAEAEKVAAESRRTARKPKAGKKITPEQREKEIDQAAVSLTRKIPEAYKANKKAQVMAKISKQPITLIPETWPGQEFIEIKHLGSNVLVRLNMSHPFYTEVYAKLVAAEKQEDDESNKEIARFVRNGLDLLIVAFARAEGQYENPAQFDSLRTNWGLELRDLIQCWTKKQ